MKQIDHFPSNIFELDENFRLDLSLRCVVICVREQITQHTHNNMNFNHTSF